MKRVPAEARTRDVYALGIILVSTYLPQQADLQQ